MKKLTTTLFELTWIFIQMLYLFVCAIVLTLPIYVSVQVISWVLFKQKTMTTQKQ